MKLLLLAQDCRAFKELDIVNLASRHVHPRNAICSLAFSISPQRTFGVTADPLYYDVDSNKPLP